MNPKIIVSDITKLSVDAIVNAANCSLMGGGGVDGAIHSAAGPELISECIKVRENLPDKMLLTGEAVITKGYNLPAKYVIHTVGPVWVFEDPNLLYKSFYNSLKVAEEHNLNSIAFPAISTGAFQFPKDECAKYAKKAFSDFPYKSITSVTMCMFSDAEKNIFEKVFSSDY
jgi:O-acetyl-ADP-ribose deacetylase (regulator of RNase III)